MSDTPKQPWDAALAAQAAAVDQCIKLGGIVIKPKTETGFGGKA